MRRLISTHRRLNCATVPIAAINPDDAGLLRARNPRGRSRSPSPSRSTRSSSAIRDQWDMGLLAELSPSPRRDRRRGRCGRPKARPGSRSASMTARSWWSGCLSLARSSSCRSTPPPRALRAGNAGDVFISVDGVVYGPVGAARGRWPRTSRWRRTDVRERFPLADAERLEPRSSVASRGRARGRKRGSTPSSAGRSHPPKPRRQSAARRLVYSQRLASGSRRSRKRPDEHPTLA